MIKNTEQISIFPHNKISRFIQNSSFLRLSLLLVFAMVFISIPVVVSFFENNFINEKIVLDASHDYGYYIQFCFGYPLVIFLINKYFNTFSKSIPALINSQVFNLGESEKRILLKKSINVLVRKSLR